MRNPVVIVVLLVLFALAPIGAWIAMAANLDPGGLGRNIGKAILLVLSPLSFAGLLMILGAIMLNRTRRAGRVFATVGAGIVVAEIGFFAAMWLERASRCIERANFCAERYVEGGSLLLYAIAHIGLIALIWRARRDEIDAEQVGGASRGIPDASQ